MGVLLAFDVTRRHPARGSKREATCHLLVADFQATPAILVEVLDAVRGTVWRSRRVHAAWGIWGMAKDSRRSL